MKVLVLSLLLVQSCISLQLGDRIMGMARIAAALSTLVYDDDATQEFVDSGDRNFYTEGADAVLTARLYKYCIAAYRGTKNSGDSVGRDWLQNLDTTPVTLEGKCQAARGIYDAYMFPYWETVENDMRTCMDSCSDCQLLLTGHSQGGATAHIAAVRLQDLDPTVIVFGAIPALSKSCSNVINTDNIIHFVQAVPGMIGLAYDAATMLAASLSDNQQLLGHEIMISTDDLTGVDYVGRDKHLDNGPYAPGAHASKLYNSTIYALSRNSLPLRITGFASGKRCTESYECVSQSCRIRGFTLVNTCS